MIFIREVPGTNLGPETVFLDRVFPLPLQFREV
jgi:hypothetical protein